jgi:DNA ligase (NAD+)
MDIDGLGEKIVDQLVDSGLVESFADLYRLQEAQLLTLESFGKRKAEKLLQGIEDSKQRGLARVLAAISIRHVGTRVASVLAKKFVTIDRLQAASVAELSTVEEIGQIIAESVYEFLHSESGEAIIRGLSAVGVRLAEDEPSGSSDVAASSVLAGKTLVVTGTLLKYKRDEIESLIERLGGRAASSVSKNTNYLVAGENAGSKLEKAQQLGIPILSEDEFQKLVEGY